MPFSSAGNTGSAFCQFGGKSPLRRRKLLALLAGVLLQAQGFAATVPDLYVAQGPVTETSSAGLDDAFSRALAEVLVKLTGRRDPLANPAVRTAIGSTPWRGCRRAAGR